MICYLGLIYMLIIIELCVNYYWFICGLCVDWNEHDGRFVMGFVMGYYYIKYIIFMLCVLCGVWIFLVRNRCITSLSPIVHFSELNCKTPPPYRNYMVNSFACYNTQKSNIRNKWNYPTFIPSFVLALWNFCKLKHPKPNI